jgi:hypothetical protein
MGGHASAGQCTPADPDRKENWTGISEEVLFLTQREPAGAFARLGVAQTNQRSSLSHGGAREVPPPGEQAQVDLARFEVAFTDEPGVTRIVWLFSLVLGHSRLIWARFVRPTERFSSSNGASRTRAW